MTAAAHIGFEPAVLVGVPEHETGHIPHAHIPPGHASGAKQQVGLSYVHHTAKEPPLNCTGATGKPRCITLDLVL